MAAARRPGRPGIGALDTERLRMTFPARVRVRLRSGSVREAEGEERGASGRPIAEQRAVVAERERAVGLEPAAAYA